MSRAAFSAYELLAVIFIFALVTGVHQVVLGKYGQGPALLAGLLALLVGVGLVILFYRWIWYREKQQLIHLREKYRIIYRVKELPADPKNIIKPDAAEIQIGDFGWDAHPNRRDGLIHLQGLTPRWQVVWHAAFRPDQIEKVAAKPASQYDYWIPDWVKRPPPPPCPYPIRERSTPSMGLPHHYGHYFKNYPPNTINLPQAFPNPIYHH